ncbi:hypothetical protein SNOG_06728 [Parastagonospora nodorum SN15]|uniref:Uncharacterized protein n=1 Tax=Phaeosphaeria nodorum (strain SN15 / ATCC MYA-4574 / FGSC 10173) TaxID=321614 RepID=Q0UND6_PHANO|nr:hypothetical protein SNOG_06728 [Parastagonospora nodorum SN15]EAT85379.1 hypothetical protein SNOG_06728 [Parastagonospora nodorum SN15]
MGEWLSSAGLTRALLGAGCWVLGCLGWFMRRLSSQPLTLDARHSLLLPLRALLRVISSAASIAAAREPRARRSSPEPRRTPEHLLRSRLIFQQPAPTPSRRATTVAPLQSSQVA